MVRELADYNPDRIATVLHWPMREALLCFLHRMQRLALDAWRHDTAVWASIAPYAEKKIRQPSKPRILRERIVHDDDESA